MVRNKTIIGLKSEMIGAVADGVRRVRNKTIIGLKFYLNPTSLYHKPVRNKTIIGLKS